MKTNHILNKSINLGCVAGLLFTAGCASKREYSSATGETHYKRSTGEYLDDKTITARIKGSLISDDLVRARDVNVTTFNGTVQLSGFVDTEEQKQAAQNLAASVSGVRKVENNISLKPTQGTDKVEITTANDTTTGNADTTARNRTNDSIVDPQDVGALSAKKILGMKVENTADQKLGDLEDLIVDTRTGNLSYAVVASGGVLGLGEKRRIVAPSAFKYSTGDRNLVLDVAQSNWKSAPAFEDDRLATYSDETRMKEVYSYYNVDLPGTSRDLVVGRRDNPREILTPTGSETGRLDGNQIGRLHKASDLIGMNLVNRDQEKIGEIKDLVVDLRKGRPAYALIETDQAWQRDGKYLIAMGSLGLASSRNDIVVDVNRQLFTDAKAFREEDWRPGITVGAPIVYRYDTDRSVTPTGIDRNRRTTAFDQSESQEDLDLSARIRRELTSRDDLSTAGKNVKVITRDGKVYLTGTVRTNLEKKQIEDIAERIAGSANRVENDLLVDLK